MVGLVKVPYMDTKQYGISGFVTGVPKGIVGVTTKSVVGILDAVTHTGNAVRINLDRKCIFSLCR